MLARGLLIALAGFLFIFIPGLPMRLLARPGQAAPRPLLYWGMLIWVVTLLVGLFFQSLLRQAFRPGGSGQPLSGHPADLILTLIGALLQAFFLEMGTYWMLRRRRAQASEVVTAGLTLGYGVGLICQVFTGLALVGAGFRLAFGDTSEATLATLAASPMLDLLLGLAAMVLFRLALLVVRGVLGVLVGEAAAGRRRLLWLAIALDAAFAWVILVLQVAMGGERPGQILAGQVGAVTAAVSAVYYLIVFAIAYRWLKVRLLAASPVEARAAGGNGRARAAARKG